MISGTYPAMVICKRLLNTDDMKAWQDSATFEDLISFITSLANSVRGRENTDYTEPISPEVEGVCGTLESVRGIIDAHPVVQDANTSRFGKIEFRDFYDDLNSQSKTLITGLSMKLTNTEDLDEVSQYLVESWGNRTRIDYGSGHELNFICFLYCLVKLGVLDMERDAANIVLKIFIRYLALMRELETKYWLEPAGSHGVWGLDDYHFLPFLFGAFQLSMHKHLKPKSIHNPELTEIFENRYLYFGCISFINRVKSTATLRWHSPMLDDISGVKTWAKVAEGMIKMYKVEVLGKLPIMQHFYFGRLLPCPQGVSKANMHAHSSDTSHDGCGTTHLHNTWGDCCGIPIPSAIAASQMESKKHSHRPIPFD